MLEYISYYTILGWPIISYLGIITLVLLLLTASVSILNARGVNYISFKWHPRFAKLTIVFALAHAFLGIALRL